MTANASEPAGFTKSEEDARVAVFKALGDDTRLRLLRLLFREELNVQELATILAMGQPRISRHLAVLRNVSLVHDRCQGTKVYYTLAPLAAELSDVTPSLERLGKSEHPDLARLDECLFSRQRAARSFADHAASQWDEIGRLLHSSSASLLAVANLGPRLAAVADLGTGTGVMLPFLAALADRVFAVDQSAQMLDHARLRCRRLGIDNVTFLQGTVEDLQPLPPCDAVLLHFVLHQVARPPALLRHVAAFLRPGGRVVVVDRVQHQDEKAKTTFGSIWLGFAEGQIRTWMKKAGLHDFGWQAVRRREDDGDDPQRDVFVAAARKAAAGS